MSRRFFDWLWPIAILLLPWQTRWFRDASLAGWPWEQGRWSVYASWFVLLGVIVCGSRFVERKVISSTKKRWLMFGALFVVSICASLVLGSDPAQRIVPIVQWSLQIGLLGGLVWVLWATNASWIKVAAWFEASLVPQVVLGFWQWSVQSVFGIKWLGMAAHLPATLGTAVVESGGLRLLRVYGGFPHPNIFGGWLALGIVVCVWLAAYARSKRWAMVWSMFAAASSVVLVLTFARGAWIAAAVGVAASAFFVWRGLGASVSKRFAGWAVVMAIVAACIVGGMERQLLVTRLDPGARLEAKSLDARAQSLADGAQLFLAHPWFGTGPNAELLDLAGGKLSSEPLEPPHNIFLLSLVDLGAFGSLVVAFFLGWLLFRLRLKALFFLLPGGVLGLFDHYLWSSWSGQCLLAIILILSLTMEGVAVYPPLDKKPKNT